MAHDPISAVRSFYRALTLRAGVFTDRFLGRGRPLGQSRLIFEIGKQGAGVRELRSSLGLDSGYLSRMLRSLERQGLVEVTRRESDLRSRHARLTPVGLKELEELNRLGDRFAEITLEPLNEADRNRLVAAMSEVEKLLNVSFTRIALEDPASREARGCLEQYFAELEERFQDGFDVGRSISAERRELTPPGGAFLMARLDGRPAGCGAVKTVEPGIGSIKRMWVREELRGIGLGRRLLLALEEQAAGLGLERLQLETHKSLHEAQTLYCRNGYRVVEAFNDDPYADYWLEKRIGGIQKSLA